LASNWLHIDTGFPSFTGQESTEDKVTTIQNYLFMLVEQLRYTLHNLDLGNMNETAVGQFAQTLTEPIYVRIQDEEDNIAQLAVTAQGLASRVSDAEGSISVLEQTASGLSSTVAAHTGQISVLEQTVNGFTLSASNGSDSSTLSLLCNGVLISSASIAMSGMVTFFDLSTDGYSTINGGNITTGTIMANNVGVSNEFSLYSGGSLFGYMGCGYGRDGGGNLTYGAMLSSADSDSYVIVTNAGTRLQSGNSFMYVVDGGCHASSAIVVDSDRRVKHDIDYGMEKLDGLFRKLRPCRFRYNEEFHGRLHSGFIAQDVENAMNETGLSYDDFAALVKNPRLEPEYSIAYGEFAALNTYMIQRLMERVDALEGRQT